MKAKNIRRLAAGGALLLSANMPVWASTGGRLAATQAISAISGEFSGPLAYGVSLIMVIGSAVTWWRHHHDMGALGQGLLGGAFISGIALGGATLLSFVPGASGAVV